MKKGKSNRKKMGIKIEKGFMFNGKVKPNYLPFKFTLRYRR